MAEIILTTSGEAEKERIAVDGCITVREAQQILCPERDDFRMPTIAMVEGVPVLRERGGWDKPLPANVIIIFVELPLGGGGGGGGGSNTIGIIFAVAALVVMWWNPGGYIAAGMGLTGGMASFVGAAITGAIVVGMGLLAGALAGQQGIPSGQLSSYSAASASPTYNVNSSSNEARLGQPEPEGFGRMLITPDYVAKNWSMYIENVQVAFFVYGIGRGEYQVESMQFGDTVFWTRTGGFVKSSYADGLEFEVVKPGAKVTLFPDNVYTSQEVSGQTLFGPNDTEFKGEVGPYAANPPGTKITKIYIDEVYPNGLGRYDNNGNLAAYTISRKYLYQKIDDYGNALSDWAVLNEGSLTLATLTPQRKTLECNVAAGRWLVKAVRTSNASGDGRTRDTLQWTSLRGLVPGSLTYNQTCIAVKIKSQNALSQGASNKFKVLQTRMLPLWDAATRTWSALQPTRSWAAAVSSVVRCQWGGRLTDDQVNLDAIWAFGARLDAKNWHYDAYIDGAYNVWQLVIEMCQPVFGIPRLEGTILNIIEDAADRPARYTLTPRHIRRGTFGLTFLTWDEQTPDDVTLDYLDEAVGYAKRDVPAVLPESESREPKTLEMLGVVNREHGFRVALGYAARNRWRRIKVECEVEGMGRRMLYGDICIVSHPRFRDTANGIVRGWDAATLTLTLRKDSGKLPDDNPHITLTTPSGEPWGPVKLASLVRGKRDITAMLDADDYAALLLQGYTAPFEWMRTGNRSIATAWILQSGSEFKRRMIVDRVVPSGLYRYAITLVNDHPNAYGYGDLTCPPYEQRGQLPVVETLAAPGALNVRIGYDTNGGRLLVASWLTVAGADGYEVQTSSDGAAWARQGRYNINAAEIAVPAGLAWLRVCAVTTDLQSDWTQWHGDTELVPPAAPVLASVAYAGGALSLVWQAAATATAYNVSLYDASAQAVLVATGVTSTSLSFALAEAQAKGGPWRAITAAIVAVNAAGNGPALELQIADAPPAKVTGATTSATASSVIFSAVSGPAATDLTGYVLLRGANATFTAAQATEARVVPSLPYVWGDLPAGTACYFRVAGKDAFFDAAADAADLNFSDVITVTTGS